MREHPIPQDIVGYRFHIVGSMTLKQFTELALGAILGLIIYATNLPPAIKWPLIFIAGLLGAAAAFLPIEERPLNHWITTFFKTLYRPTKFFWEKSSKIPDLFLFEVGQGVMEKKDDVDLTPIRRKRIKEYLASTKSISNYPDSYDRNRQSRIKEIMQAFDEVVPDEVEVVKQIEKPNLKVRTRSLEKTSLEKEVLVYDQNTEPESKTILKTNQVAQKIGVPVTETTNAEVHSLLDQESKDSSNLQQGAYATNSDTSNQDSSDQDAAVFNASLPFPSKPTVPNKLVGMVLTANNELIPEAVVAIKDEQNRVVRAVKSNALGQFFISTPLKNGSYNIKITHPRYQFNSQEVILNNDLVEPIEVRGLR